MPTGYTEGVDSGKVTTLSDYLTECAKAFLWEYREDLRFSDPLPETTTFRDGILEHENKSREKTLTAIYELEGLSDAECEARAKAEAEARRAEKERSIADQLARHARHKAMFAQVNAWECPPELAKIKEFMLEQLTTSDPGADVSFYHRYYPDEPTLTAAEWRARARAGLQSTLAKQDERIAQQEENRTFEKTRLGILRAEIARLSATT